MRDAPGVRYSAWRRPAAVGGGLSEWRSRTVYVGASAADVAAFQLDSPRRCEWDEGVDAFAPLDAAVAEAAAVAPPELQFWRMRYPAPFCPRDYVLTRRVWRQPYSAAAYGDAPGGGAPGGDTVFYSVSKAPAGPLPAELEAALPPGRTHRVAVYEAGMRVRPVPGGAELESIYFEDAGIKPSVVEWTVRRSLWGFVEKQANAMRAYVPTPGGVGASPPRPGLQVGVRRQRPRQGRFGFRAALKAAGGAAKTYVAAVGRAAVAACAANGGDGTPRRVRSFSAPPPLGGVADGGTLSPPGTPRRRRGGSFNVNATVTAAAVAAAAPGPQLPPGTPRGRSRGGAFEPVAALMAPLQMRARVGASIRRRAAAAFAAGASHVAAERARREAREMERFGPFVPVGDPPRRRRGELRGKMLMLAAAVALRVLRRAPLEQR